MERDELEKKMADELLSLEQELSGKSVQEIEDYKLGLKQDIERLKALARAAERVRALKINREGLARSLGVPVDHLTDDDVRRFLEIARTPKDGDVVAVPGVAVLTAKGQGGQE